MEGQVRRHPIALFASFFALGISQAKSEAIEFSCFAYSDFKIDGDRLFRNGTFETRAINLAVTPNYITWRERPDALGMFNDFKLDRDTGTMTVDEYSRGQSKPFRSVTYTCIKPGEHKLGKI
jgi:hypothetical protein